jgi:hypothetical protein
MLTKQGGDSGAVLLDHAPKMHKPLSASTTIRVD